MRTAILAIAAIGVGLATGAGMAWSEFAGERWRLPGSALPPTQTGYDAEQESSLGIPQVVVTGGDVHDGRVLYDFGSIEFGETGRHTFVFRNVGTAPLTLKKGHFSCKCTLADLAEKPIAPGESAEVLIEWTPKAYTDLFSHGGDIHTNDPARPTVHLAVEGAVVQTIRPIPNDFALGSISSSSPQTATMTIYNYRSRELHLEKHEFESPETAQFYEIAHRSLSADEVANEKGAKSGIEITLTTKSGLPLGPINQRIRLTLDQPTSHEIEAAIHGTVVGDISFIASNFNSEKGVLRLGAVPSAVGAERTVHVMVKGPHRHEMQLTLGRIWPEGVLEADLGEPREINEGAVVMIPLQVRVKPGSRPSDHLGVNPEDLGVIEIETTHPDTKKAMIYVSFLVENSN